MEINIPSFSRGVCLTQFFFCYVSRSIVTKQSVFWSLGTLHLYPRGLSADIKIVWKYNIIKYNRNPSYSHTVNTATLVLQLLYSVLNNAIQLSLSFSYLKNDFNTPRFVWPTLCTSANIFFEQYLPANNFFQSFITTFWNREFFFCCRQSLFILLFYGGDQRIKWKKKNLQSRSKSTNHFPRTLLFDTSELIFLVFWDEEHFRKAIPNLC